MPPAPHFCDACPRCRPAFSDPLTDEPLPATHPLVVAAARVWEHATDRAQRRAFVMVTAHGSRDPADVRQAAEVMRLIHAAADAAGDAARRDAGGWEQAL